MKVKISADISQEAKDMLQGLTVQHERSYGWLIDRMIKKYCGESKPENKTEVAKVYNPKFVPPTQDELHAYFYERGGSLDDANTFFDFYQSKNWMVGKNKMKDWKAAVRNWMRKEKVAANDRKSKGDSAINSIGEWLHEQQ